ncbi:MAG TPA: NAD(P)/FAD-dependent oxidoreductase, partial [Polyangiaceae bacterium]|nr:NAD(P)/FAD-dependent oxidoreductase [Polyangiaceae bacterium]
MKRSDVIVVGGGPAGLTSAVAMRAADPKLHVRVLEKARYPREKYCAGALGGRGLKILDELDMRPDVPSVPIDGISLRA